MAKQAPSTQLIHHPYRAPEGWDAVPVPVAKASTVLFKDTADLHKPRPRDSLSYRYGLHGTPTSYTLVTAHGLHSRGPGHPFLVGQAASNTCSSTCRRSNDSMPAQ